MYAAAQTRAAEARAAQTRAVSVIADPTRARILRLMHDAEDGRVLVERVAEALALRQPTVSHHMKALLYEGVVTRTPDGRRVWYAIAPYQTERISALLGTEPVGGTSSPDLERITTDLAERF